MAGVGEKHTASPPTNRSDDEDVAVDKIGEKFDAVGVKVIDTWGAHGIHPRGD